MSSSVPIPSLSTPSSVGGAVRRMDALFGVFRYARLLSSPPTTADTDTNTAMMTDRRIVRVTGPLVHSDILGKVLWFVGESIEGVHVMTIPIASIDAVGVAVNAKGTVMVISSGRGELDDKLYLYSLPGGELLKTIGGDVGSSEPGEFDGIRRVCFGPDDSIVVADRFNNRLQEFNSAGEYKRSIAITDPWAVCVSNNNRMIGVGVFETQYHVVELLDYSSGAVIRTMICQFASYVSGIRFTADDQHMLAVAPSTGCVTVLSVANGSLVRRICEELDCSKNDLCFAGNGDIIVADCENHRICVFDADGAVLLRRFGREGSGDGEFSFPTAVCCVGGRLYVLDYDSPRVQVFE